MSSIDELFAEAQGVKQMYPGVKYPEYLNDKNGNPRFCFRCKIALDELNLCPIKKHKNLKHCSDCCVTLRRLD